MRRTLGVRPSFLIFCCAAKTAVSILVTFGTRRAPRRHSRYQRVQWRPVQYRQGCSPLLVRSSDKGENNAKINQQQHGRVRRKRTVKHRHKLNETTTEGTGPQHQGHWFRGELGQNRNPREEGRSNNAAPKSPFPTMPSQVFLSLADSQFELLASSLLYPSSDPSRKGESKVKSMALYLPQENPNTGQLEFLPTALYPCPTAERVFIASHSGSGLPPTLPRTLTKLPGFAHAQSLIPTYPFTSSVSSAEGESDSAAAVGAVEEVMCDETSGVRGSALSVPIYFGSQTVGVLLVWPSVPPYAASKGGTMEVESWGPWTEDDKLQVSRSAHSLALALSMDNSRTLVQSQKEQFKDSLADNLHQLKNPLQAMRTYAKLLQRKIAMEEGLIENDSASYTDRGPIIGGKSGLSPPHLLSLAENMLVQSDRVIDLLSPMDSLVNSLENDEENWQQDQRPLLGPWVPSRESNGDLTLWSNNTAQKTPSSNVKVSLSDRSEIMMGKDKPVDRSRQNAEESKHGGNMMQASGKIGSGSHSNSYHKSVGDFETEMAFVPDVLKTIVFSSKEIASDNGINYEVVGMEDDSDLPGVCLCPKALQEAMANLLDNAIKYAVVGKHGANGDKNSSPKIRVTLMPNQKPYKPGVTILVEDNGPGIPSSDREACFERGFRGKSTNHIAGSGIGLDISRAMVSRMGGILEVAENENGQLDGAVMRLILFRDP